MRLSYILLAASGTLASAGDWAQGRRLDGRGGYLILPARQTRASSPDSANGWTPKPTEAPILPDEVDEVDALELVRRQQEWIKAKRQRNTWIDESTCGWRAGTRSAPFVCESGLTCATNIDEVVACDDGSGSDFFTACFDYQASLRGACASMGAKTGCCMSSTNPACITYLWAGPTPRSMYRCYATQTIITMLDEPQFVIDSRTRTTSATPTTSTASFSSISSSITNPALPGETTSSAPPPAAGGGGSDNVGVIVGGVVGGVGGIALIAGLVAFLLIRHRNQNANGGGSHPAYSAVAPGDTSYPGAGGMGQPGGYPPPGSPPMSQQPGFYTPATVAATLVSNNTTPPAPGMYDTRQSYYEPHKVAEYQQQHPQQHSLSPTAGYPAHPGSTPPPGGAYPAPHQAASELENTAAAGQQSNPVEMAAAPMDR